MNYIYTLSDPITNEVRYVGKSVNPHKRYKQHICEAKNNKLINYKVNWIKHLLKKDIEPKLDIIDEIDGEWGWLEEYWISQFKTWGFNLVNNTDGGENPPSWKGKTHSDEYKEVRRKLMLSNNPTKNMNEQWKQNISLAHKNNGYIPIKAAEASMKKVSQFTLEGIYIKTWDSLTEAAKGIGLKRSAGIGAVCNGKRNKAGGFKWKLND